MSALTSCPKCSGRVIVPSGAGEDGWVRCPICGAEYRVSNVVEYEPAELELIDEPAVPAEGRMPHWGAVAAATMGPGMSLGAAEVAAPVGDLPEVEMLVPPPAGVAESVDSAQFGEDAEVITFDDSLLLDEPTDALPGLGPPALPASASLPAASMSDDDFFKAMSGNAAVGEPGPSASDIDWPEDDTLEPYELSDEASPAAELNAGRLVEAPEGVEVFESVEEAGKARSAEFGLPPRRRSRRGNPIVMFLGIVGGGVLGLPIGYAILMWGFSKDPFALGPKLPDLLVPAALRATSNHRVVQYSPADEDAGDSEASNTADTSIPSEQPSVNEEDPLFPLPGRVATNGPSNDSVPANAAGADSSTKDTAADEAPLPTTATPTDDTLANPFGDSASTQPAAKAPTAEQPPAANEEDAVGPTVERRFSVEDLMAAVHAAKATTESAVKLPPDVDPSKRNAINFAYYASLAKVAEALTHLDRGIDEQSRNKAIDAAIGSFLDAAPTPAQLAELGKLAGYWFGNPRGNGIVLAGMVKDSKPSGKLVESVVQSLGKPMKGDPQLITVVSASPLTDDPNRPVLVAGTIVNRPAANLRGYEGSAERVVWSALAIDPRSPRSE
ncbi:MAG: hypothetical protein WD894_09210 [Pirellulales bacterium]